MKVSDLKVARGVCNKGESQESVELLHNPGGSIILEEMALMGIASPPQSSEEGRTDDEALPVWYTVILQTPHNKCNSRGYEFQDLNRSEDGLRVPQQRISQDCNRFPLWEPAALSR